ncbi:MAG: flagellar hook-associated protein FlgK [Gemmatimonadaceae bacterium]
MSSFGSILSIARSAIAAQQIALQTTSQNIANAETAGYSRQRAEFATRHPQQFTYGNVGTGVDVNGIVRMRDELLDAAYRRDAAGQSGSDVRQNVLGGVEEILGEPSTTGLSSTLDKFWNAWSDLSNNPGNAATQSVVRQRGIGVTNQLNSFSTRIADVSSRTRANLASTVDEVNSLARQYADLNKQITAAEASGQQAPDLRDARDRLSDQLSQTIGARVEKQANGSISIYVGTMMLVDSSHARPLEVRGSMTAPVVGFVNDPDPVLGLGGSVGQMINVISNDIPAVISRLDAIARGLVNGVNEYHASGWTAAGDALGNANWVVANGPTGSRVNFFDAASLTAGTIKLSAEVTASAAVIASGDVQNAPGNNTLALSLGALRDDAGMSALQTRMGASFATQIGFGAAVSYGDHYTQTVADLGVSVADAKNQYSVYETLAKQSDNRRASVNGVSLDEELTLLMRHQQAYAAASKLVIVADEMSKVLLNMI